MKKKILWTSIASTCVGVLNLILLIVLSATNIVSANFLSYMFLLGFFVTTWIPFCVYLIFKTNINLFVLICYEVFLVLSLLVGSLWHVYNLFGAFDIIVHFASGVLIALIAYMFFSNSKKNKVGLVWLFLIVFSVSMMCGGVWEIWEFVTDAILKNDSQITGGLVGRAAIMDTMTDIICDFAGGIVGGVVVVLMEISNRKKTKEIENQNKENDEKKILQGQ